jgi:lysophospholipase L1-like esterase
MRVFAFSRLLAPAIVWAGMVVAAQAGEGHWRFDFGSGAAARGYQKVLPDAAYSNEAGYGFEPGAVLHGVIRNRHALRGDFITGDGPFLFSVAVPEGDYRVTITFGDTAGVSDTTVKAESRRLMLEHVTTGKGEFATRSFVVDVRDAQLSPPPPNAPGGTQVRLNDREQGSYTWDDKLTLAFSGTAPKVDAMEIERVEVSRVFLLGDSTVTDQRAEPYASWGQMLPRFFGPDIAIANYAESSETLKSFLTSLRLDKVLSQVRPGDWVLIQFGHNDKKAQWPQTYAPAETTYRAYLRTYIAEVRRLGANPVLVTQVERRTFDAQGRIVNSHGAYPDAVRAVAADEGVSLIDLHAMSTTLYEAWGVERAPLAFALGPEGRDPTHHSDFGAYELARCVVQAMQDMSLPLARHLLPGLAHFDPAHPDKPEDISL